MNLWSIIFLVLAGFFLAAMDARQWAQDGFKRIFGFLGDKFNFEKGQRILLVVLKDSWHVAKMLMAGCISAFGYAATGNAWYLLSGVIWMVAFMIFYHGLLGAKI